MPNVTKSPWIMHYDGTSCNGCDIEVLALSRIHISEPTRP